jgi:hypothetical protein
MSAGVASRAGRQALENEKVAWMRRLRRCRSGATSDIIRANHFIAETAACT